MNLTLSDRLLQRRQRVCGPTSSLNLVALMDVFTILVFFFLAHSSNVVFSGDQGRVQLPESVASQLPRSAVIVTITQEHILLQGDAVGRVVSTLESALSSTRNQIDGLRSALLTERAAGRSGSRDSAAEATDATTDEAAEIIIMGDRSTPFRVIKKVMLTCTRAGYGRISLSVIQRSDLRLSEAPRSLPSG